MAQKGLMKFLSRKDGKNTVSDNKDNEKVKLTRVLEFVQARKPEQAKLGEVVRFMYYPGDGLAAYWMQGHWHTDWTNTKLQKLLTLQEIASK